MSTPNFGDYRNGGATGQEAFEDKMQQIRELLFGEFKRDSDARLALIEARVRELETGLHRKLDQIQARLEQLGAETLADRRASFDTLADQLAELGNRVRHIGRD